MNKLKSIAIVWVALLCFPLTVTATDGHDHGSQGHEKTSAEIQPGGMKHDDHGKTHDMHDGHAGTAVSNGAMMIVGSMVSKGVKGMAHLKDVSETAARMGMTTTHHFMITFVDEATGEKIEKGAVALKITNPDAKVGETIELVGMDGHFGADVVLDMKGEYHFRLGTKLADGVKRKYHFHQVVE